MLRESRQSLLKDLWRSAVAVPTTAEVVVIQICGRHYRTRIKHRTPVPHYAAFHIQVRTPVPTYSTHDTRRFHLYTIARYARRKPSFSAMQAVQRYSELAQSLTHQAFTNYNKSDGASLAQKNHKQYVYKSYSSIHIHKNKILTAFGDPSFL